MNFKNISLRAVGTLKKVLESFEKKLTLPVAPESIKLLFEDLAPIDNADEEEIYQNALNWALRNKKVMNIALTGPYGSGKSSIIKTFEKKYKEYRCLNISLATFKDSELTADTETDGQLNGGKANGDDHKEENHRLIELSILQQMFYHETEEKIPNSRFKRISEISKKDLISNTIIISMWLWGIALLLKSKEFPQFTWWPKFYSTYSNWIILFALMLMLPGSYYVLRMLIKQLNKISFSKLNFKSGEIEFNPKSETSILNKHLDEILYFFQVTKYNVVVIEDLDRFNDPEIFTKLRELNYLLNNSLQVNRRIVFLYAIKDDMFKDESRTKFFDFIIPVIPVINSNNSFEKLSDKLKLLGSEISFNSGFISDITLYIDDMRALKNIFNEYLIYKDILKKISFKHDKLLAMIIYKNIHPKDFALLHHNGGILFNVFSSKTEIVDRLVSEYEEKLALAEQTLVETNGNFLKDISELRALYLENFVSRFINFHSFELSSGDVNLTGAKEDENFKELMTSSVIFYNVYNTNSGTSRRTSSHISFKDLEKSVDKNRTYLERENIVKNAGKANVLKLNAEIAKVKKSINEIRFMTLKELFDHNPEIVTDFEDDFIDDKLLVYLVREGWIDESYSTLTSYFYEGSVSLNDMNFIMSIKNRETLAPSYDLEKPESILSRLKIEDFKREATLNFDLLDYMVNNQTLENGDKTKLIINQIISGTTNSRQFFFDYLLNGEHSNLFIKLIANQWPLMWDTLYDDSNLDEGKKISLAVFLVRHVDLSATKIQNLSKKFQNFLEAQPKVLDWFEPSDSDKVKQVIKHFNLQFENLDVSPSTLPLFDYIYSNNYYSLNIHMISEIFRVKGEENLLEKLSVENYTTIKASPFIELKKTINANIDDYFESVYLKLDTNKQESEESLIELLNNVEAETYIPDIIDGQESEIADIKSVRTDAWEVLIDRNAVAPTWHNVLNYYDTTKEIDKYLIGFINIDENFDQLSKVRFNSSPKFDANFYSAFSKKLLLADISDEAFAKILANYPFYYDKLSNIAFETISETKMGIILNNKTLRLSDESYKLVKEKFEALTTLLIENNAKEFFDNRTLYELENEDYLILLKSNKISKEQKLKLIEELTPEIIDDVEGLSTILSKLLVEYQYGSLGYDVLKSILTTSSSSVENVLLFYRHLKSLSKDQITATLKTLGEPYSKITVPKKQPTLPATDINRLIGQELESKGYVYKAKPDKDKIRFYNK